MKDKSTDNKSKKPIYKKWWFWAIIVVFLLASLGNQGTKDGIENGTNDTIAPTQSEEQVNDTANPASAEEQSNSKFDNIHFSHSKVRNDVTGNWRVSAIAENIDIKDYALDYYKKYFESDNEIHAIINFNYKTTTKISVMGNLLDVTIFEYVNKEEHDAKLLFSGEMLKEYHINMDTGEIEEI